MLFDNLPIQFLVRNIFSRYLEKLTHCTSEQRKFCIFFWEAKIKIFLLTCKWFLNSSLHLDLIKNKSQGQRKHAALQPVFYWRLFDNLSERKPFLSWWCERSWIRCWFCGGWKHRCWWGWRKCFAACKQNTAPVISEPCGLPAPSVGSGDRTASVV